MPEGSQTPPPSGFPEGAEVQVVGQWRSPDDMPIVWCNQMAIQGFQESLIVTFGYLAPPLLQGSREEQAAQIASIGPVDIQPLARFAVPLSALTQMASSLRDIVDQISAMQAAAGGQAPEASE